MPAPFNAPWQVEPVTATKLNRVTHGSGTSAERDAIQNWQTDRVFYDTDMGLFYRNVGTADNVNWQSLTEDLLEPVGVVKMFSGMLDNIPNGYLLCDGAILNIADQPALFAVIGNAYGGDGVNTFTLPSMRDRFPRGASPDADPGAVGGADAVTLTIPQMPVHNHSVTNGIAQTVNQPNQVSSNSFTPNRIQPIGTSSAGGSQPHENRPRFLEMLFIIKT